MRIYRGITAMFALLTARAVFACGGFFCSQVPIDQAGEQIIFHQAADEVTAMIQIQYAGEAVDFAWVVPVAGIPALAVGSDSVFAALERATRPQFRLERDGFGCQPPIAFAPGGGGGGGVASGSAAQSQEAPRVTILEESTVGPFDTQVITSDDPEALARWLDRNGYDLSERGAELIGPYVAEGLNFLTLKLTKGQDTGDIRPLIMQYTYDSATPMIPIRLTAVAATPDMGILVWIAAGARAIPLNYPHVEVDYAQLDWYRGSRAGYASYQNLVTQAMNEAGGHGFATDFAGYYPDLPAQLPSGDEMREAYEDLIRTEDILDFYDKAFRGQGLSGNRLLAIIQEELPPNILMNPGTYQSGEELEKTFGRDKIAQVRGDIEQKLLERVIVAAELSLKLLEGEPYITRLYTTLSPEDMTLDPVFSYNERVGDQTVRRVATLRQECIEAENHWELELGPGTGRDGEIVLEGSGDPPFTPPPTDMPALRNQEMLTTRIESGDISLPVIELPPGRPRSPIPGGCGAGVLPFILLSMVGWIGSKRVRSG